MQNVLNLIRPNLKTDESGIWNNPMEGCMKNNSGGAYLPVVGVASCGVVIKGNNGSFVWAYSRRLGHCLILEVEL